MSTLRVFWLTLFGIGAAAVLVLGWQGGEPWTAAAFVVFFASRAARSVIKRPLRSPRPSSDGDGPARLNRFLAVTAGGWLCSGALAGIAALRGEGQEWMYVAPGFLLMGLLQLYILIRSWS